MYYHLKDDILRCVRDNDTSVDCFVLEFLRLYPPMHFVTRFTKRPIEVEDSVIPSEAIVHFVLLVQPVVKRYSGIL